MDNVLRLRIEPGEPPNRDSVAPFGACPVCERHNGHLNVGSRRWYVCHTHRVKWCAGDNVGGDWLEETQEQWTQNHWRIYRYRAVRPC